MVIGQLFGEKNDFFGHPLCIHFENLNKVVYTTASVAYVWARALMQFQQHNGRSDRRTNQPTECLIESRVKTDMRSGIAKEFSTI